MGEVYRKAIFTLILLGTGADESYIALEYLQNVRPHGADFGLVVSHKRTEYELIGRETTVRCLKPFVEVEEPDFHYGNGAFCGGPDLYPEAMAREQGIDIEIPVHDLLAMTRGE